MSGVGSSKNRAAKRKMSQEPWVPTTWASSSGGHSPAASERSRAGDSNRSGTAQRASDKLTAMSQVCSWSTQQVKDQAQGYVQRGSGKG